MTEVFVAGATGNLGGRIVRELIKAGGSVRALVRPGRGTGAALAAMGARVVEVELSDRRGLAGALAGVTTVVSALQGLEPVILDGQRSLLQAAKAAGVRKFMPSDFAVDFFKTPRGSNRNLDLRRRFDEEIDAASFCATSVLNGAFMDLLGPEAGDRILDHKRGRVAYFGDGDQPLDFTTMDDVAVFTARAALDPSTPRILRVAGDRVTPKTLAAIAQNALGRPFSARRMGGVGILRTLIPIVKFVTPRSGEMPAWQGMQYAENMFSGHGLLEPLDNNRYPDIRWTSVQEFLSQAKKAAKI